jgi:hypothetical protein
VIVLHGRLGEHEAGDLMRAFWDAIEQGAQEVWLDVSGVLEVDEGGVGTIARLGPGAHEMSRALVMICPAGPVRDRLVEAAVAADVPVFGTLSAAHYEG